MNSLLIEWPGWLKCSEIGVGLHPLGINSFLEIDFVIKINAKRSRRFDLSEAIFKCE